MTIFNLTEPGANHCFSRHMSCTLLFQVSKKYPVRIFPARQLTRQAIQPLLRFPVPLKTDTDVDAVVDDRQAGKAGVTQLVFGD